MACPRASVSSCLRAPHTVLIGHRGSDAQLWRHLSDLWRVRGVEARLNIAAFKENYQKSVLKNQLPRIGLRGEGKASPPNNRPCPSIGTSKERHVISKEATRDQ